MSCNQGRALATNDAPGQPPLGVEAARCTRCALSLTAQARASDAEEEGIEGVRASIVSYLARYSESVAKKEAGIIQARCRARCLRRSALFLAPDVQHARICLRDQRGVPAGLHMTLWHDAHLSLLGSCVARTGASFHSYLLRRAVILRERCLAATQKTSQKVMAMTAALEAEERKEAAAATAAHARRATPLRTKLERRAAAIRARDEVRPAHHALAPVMLQSLHALRP
jgi:hypothetical protein